MRRNLKSLAGLSPRESQVVTLAAEGLTDKEIARELGIGLGTVGTLWSRIRSKLGQHNRTELVVRWMSCGAHGGLSETAMRACMEAAPVGLIVLDDDDRVLCANLESQCLLGATLETLMGTAISDWIAEGPSLGRVRLTGQELHVRRATPRCLTGLHVVALVTA